MVDYQFLENIVSGTWVIQATRRAKRPNEANGHLAFCPFCLGSNQVADPLYSIPDPEGSLPWQVCVVPNTYPFAKVHELIIHSPQHDGAFDSFSLEHVQAIFQVLAHRYNEHAHAGQVVIFHNHGMQAGESLPHPHTQLAVIPEKVKLAVPPLASVKTKNPDFMFATGGFTLLTPMTSQWPDEVWISPTVSGNVFGEITPEQVKALAELFQKLLLIMDHRHHHDFPYNFYIYPGKDWYLRLIPRSKSIGGFELSTGVFVNTQDPKETMAFIKGHLHNPDSEAIRKEHKASYPRGV